MSASLYRCSISGRHTSDAIVLHVEGWPAHHLLIVARELPHSANIAAKLQERASYGLDWDDGVPGPDGRMRWRRDYETIEDWCIAVVTGVDRPERSKAERLQRMLDSTIEEYD